MMMTRALTCFFILLPACAAFFGPNSEKVLQIDQQKGYFPLFGLYNGTCLHNVANATAHIFTAIFTSNTSTAVVYAFDPDTMASTGCAFELEYMDGDETLFDVTFYPTDAYQTVCPGPGTVRFKGSRGAGFLDAAWTYDNVTFANCVVQSQFPIMF
eukprot:TRINITY_DN2273_c0_g3_i1.p1 TRINITY_DN2273_c0_g3~~TRINITY_DN2273_c0_g3_i1.p1  ORF type:complete len:156 (+),score=26.31 TRINITY_DN2273_c0_g3_i1:175-642(+)